jgi:hypothetical protein
MIIHDIYKTRTSEIEFLHKCKRSWRANEQEGSETTSMDLVFNEELEEDKVVEQQSMEAQVVQTDTGEENVTKAKM